LPGLIRAAKNLSGVQTPIMTSTICFRRPQKELKWLPNQKFPLKISQGFILVMKMYKHSLQAKSSSHLNTTSVTGHKDF